MDNAVDGGASDDVLGGQVGEENLAFGVAAADGTAGGFGQFGLLALELAVLLREGRPFAGALVPDVRF
ncbi:hypothetical protein [Streptosporangium sp. NBC_01756]|uniref:hypothetical protein n=1 Tax=Streptosporangium sp. NBC_01756 TaxID=2975950 RepID=UPI002DDAF587|nr:hypothetical protein [Streptosporangium sp. NBC_01756]WSC86506.1 hypothetical protein OIE48_40210 [Streptosporangium sp. NBC_01756]